MFLYEGSNLGKICHQDALHRTVVERGRRMVEWQNLPFPGLLYLTMIFTDLQIRQEAISAVAAKCYYKLGLNYF